MKQLTAKHIGQALVLLLLICAGNAFGQNPSVIPDGSGKPVYISNPSSWIQRQLNALNRMTVSPDNDLDTTALKKSLDNIVFTEEMMKRNFYDHAASLNLRSIYDIKMEIAGLTEVVSNWLRLIRTKNDALVSRATNIDQVEAEIKYFEDSANTVVKTVYASQINLLKERQVSAQQKMTDVLGRYTNIENDLNTINVQVYQLYSSVDDTLSRRESDVLHRELPPIWSSSRKDYSGRLFATIGATFRQMFRTIRFYVSGEIMKTILFRLFIFLLCLLPIIFFKKRNRVETVEADKPDLRYLRKYPFMASLIMGLAAAPLIFIHPPHAFMEMIFILLTAFVGYIIYREHPYLNKGAFASIIFCFILLYLINFAITPTMEGRIVFCVSIVILIPIHKIYKEIPSYPTKHPKWARAFILILSVHVILGWLLTLAGNYILGKSLILAAFNSIILILIMHVTVYSLLDYLIMVTHLINRNSRSFKINVEFVYENIRPIFILGAAILVFVGYISNLNAYDFLLSNTIDFLGMQRKIGSTTFTYGSIFLLLVSVFVAFFIAGILRNAFDTREESKAFQLRSNVGSYVLLIRFIIICAGFFVGLLASGLPLSNFTIVLGALGVGIGFGLQHITNNLISGLIIVFEKPFVIGDMLEIGEETGRVKEIGLRATRIATAQGADLLIPNGILLADKLKNWTLSNSHRLVELQINTEQEVDAEKVEELLLSALENQPRVIKVHQSTATLFSITDDALVFKLIFWVDDLAGVAHAKSMVLNSVNVLFKENNIGYPKKDIVLKSEKGTR